MKNKTANRFSATEVLFSPYILALAFAIIIIILLPDIFSRYEVMLTDSGRSEKENSVEVYDDIDGDGYSERIVAFNNTLDEPAVKILSNKGASIEQWNFRGRYPERTGYINCGDLNDDGIKEIYVFTLQSDTLLMHAIAPFTDKGVLFKNKVVTNIWWRNDTIQAFVGHGDFHDLNNDGYREMVFLVKAGFSLQPRGIYAFDLKNDTIFHSMMLGANISKIMFEDLDEDGKTEIYCSSNTLGNIHDSLNIPFNDYSSYFMGFNERLELSFPPVQYDVYPSSGSMISTSFNGRKSLIVYFHNRSEENVPSEILLFGAGGQEIMRREITLDSISELGCHKVDHFITESNTLAPALLAGSGIHALGRDLEITKTYDLYGSSHISLMADLDRDGEKEMVFNEKDGKMLILQPGLRYPVYLDIVRDPFSSIPFCVSVKNNGAQAPELIIKSENKIYFYTYNSNALYYLKYPTWLGIYLILLLIILMIRFVQKVQLRRKMEIENRMNALQLKTLKSQMDPHFMLNALNSISDNILNKQHDIAYRYLANYSKLIRMLFTHSDKLAVTLEEELAFVEQYLELEQFRYKDKFTYSIEKNRDTDADTPIPRMLLQLFVENAIKHGIRNKEGQGHIEIKTVQENDRLIISITDDGIGLQAAQKISSGHGKGLQIIDEMIGLFEKVNNMSITYTINDRYEGREYSPGTIVMVEIHH